MTERVTVEQNGERFTLEVPDGTSDEDISKFLAQQSQPSAAVNQMLTAQPNSAEYVAAQVPQMAGAAARELIGGTATANIRDAAAIAKNAAAWTPNAVMEVITHPLETAKAYVAGHPYANTPIRQIAGGVGRNVAGAIVQGAVAPENLFTLPYTMAAYEQEKIRANPTAPEYASNPYAMTVRGQAPTQAAAGEMNRQRALRTMSTAGNPAPGTPEFQQMQQQYQAPSWIDNAMNTFRKYRTVLGQ